jgi:hypothetical protein
MFDCLAVPGVGHLQVAARGLDNRGDVVARPCYPSTISSQHELSARPQVFSIHYWARRASTGSTREAR